MPGTRKWSHQRCLAEQLAPTDQIPNGDVEIGVAATPVGDLGEGVSSQNVLGEQGGKPAVQHVPPASVTPAPACTYPYRSPGPITPGKEQDGETSSPGWGASSPCLALDTKEALEAGGCLGPNIKI